MKVIKSQNGLCSGCEMCMLNCSLSKTGIVNSLLARIRLVRMEHGAARPVIVKMHPALRPARFRAPWRLMPKPVL